MSGLIAIKFTEPCSPYNEGEVAGFTEDQLARIPVRCYDMVNKSDKKPKAKKSPVNILKTRKPTTGTVRK